MSEDEKQTEIAKRITKLNDIRAELTVAKSTWREAREGMIEAGQYYRSTMDPSDLKTRPGPHPWPSTEDLQSVEDKMSRLIGDATVLIEELKGLGIDGDLFKINDD